MALKVHSCVRRANECAEKTVVTSVGKIDHCLTPFGVSFIHVLLAQLRRRLLTPLRRPVARVAARSRTGSRGGLRTAKHLHDTGMQTLGAHTPVNGVDSRPQGIDANHRSSSRIQAAQSPAAVLGQVIAITMAPRRSSIRMSSLTGRTGCVTDTATNSPKPGAWRRQRCTTLVLIRWDTATLVTEVPGAAHCSTTCPQNRAL